MKYILKPSSKFKRKLKKIIQNNTALEKKIILALDILKDYPFYPSLKTHKVNDTDGNKNYSSRVSGNIRIIWNFNNGRAEILDLIDVGGHSGGDKIYK